jgi:hypothetical protein
VQKAYFAGIPIMAAVSAPSSLAVELPGEGVLEHRQGTVVLGRVPLGEPLRDDVPGRDAVEVPMG